MTRFFSNAPETLISESIDGTLRSSRVKLSKLDVGSENINILVRSDWTKEKADKCVALISGGGSGHEPMHAGFIGEYMLTAVVCGGLYASPSVDAILSAIFHCAGKKGVMLIVKAYTGDCLNFGLAAEKAMAMDIDVEVVIFSDDISIPNHPRPRGLAGVILLHKLLGNAAGNGMSLVNLKKYAEALKKKISTIGISLSSCSLPKTDVEERVKPGTSELGLGIHGEPGVTVLETQTTDEILTIMIDKLKEHRKGPYLMLLNNLGGVSNLEMEAIYSRALSLCPDIKATIGPVHFCTSLDMKGFSITFIEMDQNIKNGLFSKVVTNAWVEPINVREPSIIQGTEIAPILENIDEKHCGNKPIEAIILRVCNDILKSEDDLNQLDRYVGDGDTGFTFSRAAKEIIEKVQTLPTSDNLMLFRSLSDILTNTMGGSSGVLLSLFFMQASNALKSGESLDKAFQYGLNKMMELGGAEPGMRTMIDALYPAVNSLTSDIENLFSPESRTRFRIAADKAEEGANGTAEMTTAGAGRSSYLSESKLTGHKDPGAAAIAIIFRSLQQALNQESTEA